MRKFLIALTLVLSADEFLVCAYSFALTSSIDTFYEFGRKGSSGLVEEEDLTDEFYYSKYNVKFMQKLDTSETSYYLKYLYYDKDFDSIETLDNHFHCARLSLDKIIYSKDDFSIKIGPDFEFKEKIYPNSKNLEYEQFKFDLPFIFKKEDDWTIKLLGGINYFYYPDAPKDQFKLNSRIDASKNFFDDMLETSAFYKFQYISREDNKDRLENTFGGNLELKIDSTLIKSIEAGFERGMDNTIIYEEREDSYDFKFLNWHVKTKHSFYGDRIRISVKYADLTRTYADFNHNFDGFLIENGWGFKAVDTKDYTLEIKFNYLHKQFRYPYVSSPYAFHNNNITPEMEFEKKGDWKALLGSEIKFYDYPAKRTNDKIYYIARASIEKHLLKDDLIIGFDYRYTFKNFLHKLDITENVYRLRATYKF